MASHETQGGKSTSYAQADHGLPSALVSCVNSDTDHSAYCVNPIRNDRPPTHREYSGSQGIARGDAVLSSAQAGVDLRSSAPTLQNSQTENLSLSAGSSEDTSSQNNGGSITSVIRDFCTLISKQNEAQNARFIQLDDRITQQNETQNAQIRQQNEAQYARMCQQGESQNNMLRECLTGITHQGESQNNMLRECLIGITNVVRENMNGITEQLSNLTGLIQSSCRQAGTREVTKVGLHENIAHYDAVTSVESCRSSNTVASNGIRHSDHSSINQPGHSFQRVQSEPLYCHVNRRDSLLAMQVSESQTYTRHAGQIDSSRPIGRPIPGNLCGPSDVSVKQIDTRGDVPRIATSDFHNTVFNPRETNIRNTNTAANTSGQHETFSRNKGVKLPVFSGNSNESWKV